MAQYQGPRAQMVRLFLLSTSIWQEDVAKIPEVPGTPRNVYPAGAITWLVGVTIYCTFSITTHVYLASFYAKNTFEKKLDRGNVY